MMAWSLLAPLGWLLRAGPAAQMCASGLCTDTAALAFPPLPPIALERLAQQGIHTPTPIQAASMERILEGESLMLHAETGSGKSLAFLLPAMLRLGLLDDGSDGGGDSADIGLNEVASKLLVLAPTRELAVQLANEAAGFLGAANMVQIVAVGATPAPATLLAARVVCATATELLQLLADEGDQVREAAPSPRIDHLLLATTPIPCPLHRPVHARPPPLPFHTRPRRACSKRRCRPPASSCSPSSTPCYPPLPPSVLAPPSARRRRSSAISAHLRRSFSAPRWPRARRPTYRRTSSSP